jgi:tRNA A-37 threonylcarbamoyl transferase component Bud32
VTAAAPPPTVPGLTGLTVLARGGYATVYRAVQESVGRDVAVKVENRTLASDRDQRRFLREARAAGRMSSHPHVVDLFDAGVTTDGHPYLIMELCDGSYAERMRNSPLSAAEAREVGFKIADALADAHSLGVLHRDVKPANILFSRFGEPALADFGLAILAEWRDVSITLDVLTPAYAPPEMFRHSAPSPAADVYALCATLYALMRGKPPRWREGQPPSLVSIVDMFAERIPDLPDVPPQMMALLRAGMSNDESARPSAIELRDALTALRLEPPAAVIIPALGSPSVDPSFSNDDTVPHGSTPAQPAGPGGAGPGGPAGMGAAGFGLGSGREAGSGGAGGSGGVGGSGAGGSAGPGGGPGSSKTGWSADAGPDRPVVRPPWPGPDRMRRRGMWWAVAAGAVALAAIVSLGIAYAASGPHHVFKTPIAVDSATATPGASSSTAVSSPTRSGSAGPVLLACLVPVPKEAKCLKSPECYDADKKLTDCAGRHTWEAFLAGELPEGVKAADADTNLRLKQVCSRIVLNSIDPATIQGNWKVAVLAPANRSFRCIATLGPNALSGPKLHVGTR